MQERMTAAAINQGSVYQARNDNEDEIHFARGRRSPHRCARAGQCRARHNQEEVTPRRNDSRLGKLCSRVARHTATLSGFGAIFSPREALEPAFFSNPDET